MKKRIDFPRMRDQIQADHAGTAVYVDDKPRPSWLEVRRKNLRIRIWQYGNSFPRIDTMTVMPKDFPLLRSILDEIDAQRGGDE